ncbi:3-dehydroquinate synthase [Flavobacteriaceae bacterium 14752]|uniref:3-dehydroquinate synthase n=1 Tax=Mesohalobacter salilacus TaxID=2491711 RepID=UPI000F62E6DB|nr:3-dehydroquinate synthase [Flavobacteriaceae bacterium 14752]
MKVSSSEGQVFYDKNAFKVLNKFLKKTNPSSLFVLVDQNTEKYCLEILKYRIDFDFKVISIQAGEEFKTLDTCAYIWETLSNSGADRKSLLINLGGGVITDIGGFTASCFKRGISFIHIPTSLLGMVDAAIGGKNGVDFKNLKNQIGVIRNPEIVIIEKDFLKTLPYEQVVSGFAEMLKHGLINSKNQKYFEDCLAVERLRHVQIRHLIDESITIKQDVVSSDIEEKGLRKVLNYGHTLGHAIESFRMSKDQSKHLLHGEAIAIGLVLETYISHKMYDFSIENLKQLKSFVHKYFPFEKFSRADIDKIIQLMKYDKKNVSNQVNFVLLKSLGKPALDCVVEHDLIYKAFKYYHIVD